MLKMNDMAMELIRTVVSQDYKLLSNTRSQTADKINSFLSAVKNNSLHYLFMTNSLTAISRSIKQSVHSLNNVNEFK